MIEVNGYRLYKKDKHNWVIEQKHTVYKGKNEGTVSWKNDGYYVNFEQACSNLLDRLISLESDENDIQTLQSMTDLIRISRNRIMKVIKDNCDEFKKEFNGDVDGSD